MAEYNFYFDVCANCIWITIFFISFFRKRVPTYRNRVYIGLFVCNAMACISDRVDTMLHANVMPGDLTFHYAQVAVSSVYFAFHLLTTVFYIIYIYALINIHIELWKDFEKIFLPYFIVLLAIIANIFYPIIFYYDMEGNYYRGKGIIVMYLIAAYYIFFGVYQLFKYRSLINRRIMLAVCSFIALIIVGILVQYFNPNILVENFCITISITLVYITINNPSESIDSSTGLLNRRAFLSGISLYVSRKEPNVSVYITVDSMRAMDTQLSRTQTEDIMRLIAGYLKRFSRWGYIYKYSLYTYAISFMENDPNRVQDVLKEISNRFKESWKTNDMIIHVDARCYSMSYPENYEDVTDLIKKIETISEMDSYKGMDIIDINNINMKSLQLERDIEKLVKNSLIHRTGDVRFQPVYENGKNIVYYDSVFYFPDQNGTYIKGSNHVNDFDMNSTLSEVDDFVLHKACQFVNKYRGQYSKKIRVSIMFSHASIMKPDFSIYLRNVLAEENVNSDEIYLKISQSSISGVDKSILKPLTDLVGLGYKVIVDNYGKGYSDVNRLVQLNAEIINMHHSLIESVIENEEFLELLTAVVDMLHDIKKKVSISDISSEKEAEIAQRAGIDFIQGDEYKEPIEELMLDDFVYRQKAYI
ncbi:MAG: EAL domain-containing protein [Butyrivibrio sp.]|nr:EAL domain-containing protein [Butyrivibrio sp.]